VLQCAHLELPMIGKITMSEIDVSAEWQMLCEEEKAAKNAHFQAILAVNHKFAAIGHGASKTNPTEEELLESDATLDAWNDVKQKMNKFKNMLNPAT
jgi:hypothetical protein